MRVLILGSSGFVGASAAREIEKSQEVIRAYRGAVNAGEYDVDLGQRESVRRTLEKVQPDAVISCAGIVENSDAAKLNVIFTTNILQSVVDLGLNLHRIITLGSAGEYGIVEPGELPVKETNPLRGTSHYAVSKLEEVKAALRYRDEYGLPVVVARLFNPIGAGMPSRQLIPRIITRLAEIKAGTADTLEVNRLDAKRDYVDVRDVATAIHILLEAKDLRYGVYNVGSGRETSNRDLIECILQYSDLSKRPNIIETASESEPIVASCADISRLRELGWQPIHTTEEVIRETIYVSK